MNTLLARQAHYALTAGLGALVLIETNAAAAKAHDLTFEGSWLIAVGAVVFVIVALCLTCLGALSSDRRDRNRSTARTAGANDSIYGGFDGQFRVR